MQTTFDIDPDVVHLIHTLANQRSQSVNDVLAEAVRSHYREASLPMATLSVDDQGFPQIRIGRPITLEEVQAAIDEE